MSVFQTPNAQNRLLIVLSGLEHEVGLAYHRRRVAMIVGSFFAAIFLVLLVGETLFATLMFSIIQVEVLGKVVSGAAFALMVPVVIATVHVKLHHESDHFTKMWLKKLSGIGVLVFALGMSLMVGYSAWQAARDAVSFVSSGPTGMLGQRVVDAQPTETMGFASWVSFIPNGLLFLGLSFGMIITIYFASFCLGRALQAFNLLTQTPPISKELKTSIDTIKIEMAAFRELQAQDDAAGWKMPLDPKHKFAREAFHVSWEVLQAKLAAAQRKFDPMRMDDPLAMAFHDADAASIPSRFKTEEEFCRHMADQIDQMRIHNVLRILTGLPEKGVNL